MEKREETKHDADKKSFLLQYRILFRVVILLHHIIIIIISLNIDLSQTDIPILVTANKYKMRYLTNWNFVMQTIYFSLALLCDIQEWTRLNEGTVARKLARFREFYFTSAVFPNTMLVTTIFWSICCLDRELIYPKIVDQIVPHWLQHSNHTIVAIAVLFDLILQPGARPFDDSKNKSTLYFLFVFYQIVLFFTYLEAGYWIYPFYNNFNISQLFMFYLLLFVVYTFYYELQWSLGKWIQKLRSIKSL